MNQREARLMALTIARDLIFRETRSPSDLTILGNPENMVKLWKELDKIAYHLDYQAIIVKRGMEKKKAPNG